MDAYFLKKKEKKVRLKNLTTFKKIKEKEPGEFCWQKEIVLDIADNVARELFYHLMNLPDIIKLPSAWF